MLTLNGNVGTLDSSFFNAAGCGVRPICAFTKNCKEKVKNWQDCVATNSAIKKAGKYGVDPSLVIPNANPVVMPEPSVTNIPTASSMPSTEETNNNPVAPNTMAYIGIGGAILVGGIILLMIFKR